MAHLLQNPGTEKRLGMPEKYVKQPNQEVLYEKLTTR